MDGMLHVGNAAHVFEGAHNDPNYRLVDAFRDILVNPLAGCEAFGDPEAPKACVAAHGLPVLPPDANRRKEVIAANMQVHERDRDALNKGETEMARKKTENMEIPIHEGESSRMGRLGDKDGIEDNDGRDTVAT